MDKFTKEKINPIVGYLFHSGWQLGSMNAPDSMGRKYLEEGTRRIKELLDAREDAERPQAAATELGDREAITERAREYYASMFEIAYARAPELLADFAARETSRQLATLEAERDAYKAVVEASDLAIHPEAYTGISHLICNIGTGFQLLERDLEKGNDEELGIFSTALDAFAALTAGTNEESK